MSTHRVLALLIAAVLATFIPAATSSAAPATLAPCGEGYDLPIGDVDGDGLADVIVGEPDADGGRGAVVVASSRPGHAPRRYTLAALGLGVSAPDDRLGAAVAVGDVDEDGCSDLVVGAPGRAGHGAVFVVPGRDVHGLDPARATTLVEGSVPGDELGSAIALAYGWYAGETLSVDAWIGAPGHDVAGRRDAGEVLVARLTHGRLVSTKPVHLGDLAAPGTADAGDRFGTVLSGREDGALAGVPSDDAVAARDAGSVVHLRLTAAGTFAPGQRLVLPRPARGDRYGAAVAGASWRSGAAAGAPGADVGRARDAGLVTPLRALGGGRLAVGARVTQASPTVPGEAAAGAAFGSALALVRAPLCQEGGGVVVGAPGAGHGAGAVLVLDLTPSGRPPAEFASRECAARLIRPSRRITAHAGASVAGLRDRDDLDEDVQDNLVLARPGDGVVSAWHGAWFGGRARLRSVRVSRGTLVPAQPLTGEAQSTISDDELG